MLTLEALNIFNALTLKQVFLKTKNFFENLDYHFLAKSATIEALHFYIKLPCQNLSQIEWEVQKLIYHKEFSFATKYFLKI